MTEKINIEFTLREGSRERFLQSLQEVDGGDTLQGCLGYRADDQVQRREALTKFVDAMEMKLRKNEHKTTWRKQPIEALFRLLLLEVEEFKIADEFFTVAEARNELVDVSNFALILYDRLGMIKQDENRSAQQNGRPKTSTSTGATLPT